MNHGVSSPMYKVLHAMTTSSRVQNFRYLILMPINKNRRRQLWCSGETAEDRFLEKENMKNGMYTKKGRQFHQIGD